MRVIYAQLDLHSFLLQMFTDCPIYIRSFWQALGHICKYNVISNPRSLPASEGEGKVEEEGERWTHDCDLSIWITGDKPYQGTHYDEKTILFSCIVTIEPFISPNETMKFQTFADLYHHNIYPTFNTDVNTNPTKCRPPTFSTV